MPIRPPIFRAIAQKVFKKLCLKKFISYYIAIHFMSSNEERVIHSKNDNKEVMIGIETDKFISKLSKSLFSRGQKRSEESMKASDSVFHCVDSLYCKCQKISLSHEG